MPDLHITDERHGNQSTSGPVQASSILIRTMIQVAYQTPEPPCTECFNKDYCASNLLACRQFEQYASAGRWSNKLPQNPEARIYDRIYRDF